MAENLKELMEQTNKAIYDLTTKIDEIKQAKREPDPVKSDVIDRDTLQKMLDDTMKKYQAEFQSSQMNPEPNDPKGFYQGNTMFGGAISDRGIDHKSNLYRIDPDSPTYGQKIYQDMIARKAPNEQIKEIQAINDQILITSKILGIHPWQTKAWRQFQPLRSELRKAMDTGTAAEGLEWIPTNFSAQMIEKIDLAQRVAGLFSTITMPTKSYTLPVEGGDAVVYKQTESSSDTANEITASTPGTANKLLTAIKLAGLVYTSEELVEDSIVDNIGYIQMKLVDAIVKGKEDCIINGDTSSTHMDSDITAAADHRKSWDGLRKLVKAANRVSLATFNDANVQSILTKLGKYGVDPEKLAWIPGAKGYLKMLTSLTNVQTRDKYGDWATVITGELSKYVGIPVITSQYMRENLAPDGYYDGVTTSLGTLALVHRPSFVIGDRRLVTLKVDEEIKTDQRVLVVTWRGVFSNVFSNTSEDIVGVGYNFSV